MISLKNYLFHDAENADIMYRRIIDLLLQGIALHAVEGDKEDYQRFRAEMDAAAASFTPEMPQPELFTLAGRVVHTLEDYNHRTSRFVRQQNTELHNMVSMLTRTVIAIGTSSSASVEKLQTIERSIEKVRVVEDIQLLKSRLGECLQTVREEAERQRIGGQSALASLQQELDGTRERIGSHAPHAELDAATGLPSKKEAEAAIQAAVDSPDGRFLFIVVVSRVHAVNARFGYAVGDRMLVACAEHLRKNLSASEQLYRWHGPALVAILSRPDRLEQVRSEIRRFADVKLEKTIDVGNRSVLIPVSAIWSVMPVAAPLDDLLKRLATFTASQVPRDYV